MKETRFKQTEIGTIPEDWDVKTLGEIAALKAGITLDFKAVKNRRYPCFGGNGIRQYVDNYLYDGDYPIIGRQGELCGNVKFANDKFYATEHAVVVSCNDIIFPKYLYYKLIDASLNQYATGCAQPGLSVENLKKVQIAISKDKSEQQRIAQVLSDTDSLIDSIEKLIAKKEAIKQGTMQQLLTGKTRLSGFAKSKVFKQTEIGTIPEDWEVKTLGELCDIKDGTHQTPKYVENGIPFYSVETVTNNDFTHTKYISEKEHLKLTNSYKIEKGDVLMTRIGSIGVCKYVDWEPNASFYVSLALLKFKGNTICAKYISLYSESKEFKKEVELNSLQFAIPMKINLGKIADIKIILPKDTSEQSAIATILSDMDAEIAALHKKLDKYRALKQGMMQQLLTGKIRLAVTEDKSKNKHVKPRANESFRRAVLAAEIADRLCEEPTFGHVKMEKLLFLTEKMCAPEIHSSYHRAAAGPYDSRALRSVDSQLSKLQWFKTVWSERNVRYVPLQKRGAHKMYFERYYGNVKDTFDMIICTFKTAKTEQCEIVATLYSAWEDFLNQGISPSDEQIVDEVLNNWNESKQRIERERWLTALDWMRKNGFVPSGKL